MGITIQYRGTIDDLTRVEAFEDRILDIVFALGGRGRIWRSFVDRNPARVVRGLIVDLTPGQDSCSLMISPEGHLTGLADIEDAEQGRISAPLWCFVKTQFGSVEGHAALVAILRALKSEFISNLEVQDESGYWDHRDPVALAEAMRRNMEAVLVLREALRGSGMSEEAMEDPAILAARIERIAILVQQKLASEQESVDRGQDSHAIENPEWSEPTFEQEVSAAQKYYERNLRRGERMSRRINELIAEGLSASLAFQRAMEEEGLPIETAEEEDATLVEEGLPDSESWEAEAAVDAAEAWAAEDPEESDCDEGLVQAAKALLLEVMRQAPTEYGPSHASVVQVTQQGLMDVIGGLVQATCGREDDPPSRASDIVQLKRASRGIAYANGGFFLMKSERLIDAPTAEAWHASLAEIRRGIEGLLAERWGVGGKTP